MDVEGCMALDLVFTKASLSEISPTSKRVYYKDTSSKSPKGFGLYVTPSGSKCFFLSRTVGGKTKRLALGHFPDLSVEAARKQADKLAGVVALGLDPIKQRKSKANASITLQKAFDDYLKVRGRNLSKNTISAYNTIIKLHLADWRNQMLSSISRDMVASRHEKLTRSSPSMSNKTMRVLRAIFHFANGQYEDEAGKGLFPDNPVDRITHTRSWNKETRRQNIIKPAHLPAWYQAVLGLSDSLFAETVRDYLLFILFTGLRRREASHLTWERVDLKAKTVLINNTKNHQNIELPLSSELEGIIQRRRGLDDVYVFAGRNKRTPLVEPKKRIAEVRKHSGVDFTLHDLRRTFITIAESLDLSTYTIKALVNHKTSQTDVTGGYIVISVDRLRDPMNQISSKISTLINPEANDLPGECK